MKSFDEFYKIEENQMRKIFNYRKDYIDYIIEKYSNVEKPGPELDIRTLTVIGDEKSYIPEFGCINNYYCKPAKDLYNEIYSGVYPVTTKESSEPVKKASIIPVKRKATVSRTYENTPSTYKNIQVDDLSLLRNRFSEILESPLKNTKAIDLNIRKRKKCQDVHKGINGNDEALGKNDTINASNSNPNNYRQHCKKFNNSDINLKRKRQNVHKGMNSNNEVLCTNDTLKSNSKPDNGTIFKCTKLNVVNKQKKEDFPAKNPCSIETPNNIYNCRVLIQQVHLSEVEIPARSNSNLNTVMLNCNSVDTDKQNNGEFSAKNSLHSLHREKLNIVKHGKKENFPAKNSCSAPILKKTCENVDEKISFAYKEDVCVNKTIKLNSNLYNYTLNYKSLEKDEQKKDEFSAKNSCSTSAFKNNETLCLKDTKADSNPNIYMNISKKLIAAVKQKKEKYPATNSHSHSLSQNLYSAPSSKKVYHSDGEGMNSVDNETLRITDTESNSRSNIDILSCDVGKTVIKQRKDKFRAKNTYSAPSSKKVYHSVGEGMNSIDYKTLRIPHTKSNSSSNIDMLSCDVGKTVIKQRKDKFPAKNSYSAPAKNFCSITIPLMSKINRRNSASSNNKLYDGKHKRKHHSVISFLENHTNILSVVSKEKSYY